MTLHYTLKAALEAVRKPGIIVGEGRRIGLELNKKLALKKASAGDDLIKLDWDVLVILDGCRHDLFTDECTLDGETVVVESTGSESREFMEAYFSGEDLHDTVYVTANPHTSKLDDGIFHDIRKVYNTYWDDDLETVRPEAVTSEAKAAATEYPRKRLIIHYMQPHFPFIGKTGRKIDRDELGSNGDIWTPLRLGQCPVDTESVWKAYAENYQLVEKEVREIQSSIRGKVVVTADHGNLIGERLSPIPVKYYGHPQGIRHPCLNQVPWHEIPASERREVKAEGPKEVNSGDCDEIESRLEALGYR